MNASPASSIYALVWSGSIRQDLRKALRLSFSNFEKKKIRGHSD